MRVHNGVPIVRIVVFEGIYWGPLSKDYNV